MSSQSLAVKYRPKTFGDVCEQKSVITILNKQIETNTFKHAYLFTGTAGTGKTTSARIFANEINKGKGSPIEIDAASNSGVDNIRTVIDDSKRKSLDSEYKVYIVDECHSLSNGAWQAMLKLLEEPPKCSIFIMCTTDPQKIPNTILSRVQRFNFNKISQDTIEKRLIHILEQEEITTYEKDAINYIAKTANGGMRDAITLLDKCLSLTHDLTVEEVVTVLGLPFYDTYFDLLDCLVGSTEKDHKESVRIIDTVYQSGNDLKLFMNQFLSFVLDVAKYKLVVSFDSGKIPNTKANKERLDKYNDNSDWTGILEFLLNLVNTIKYESNPVTIISTLMLIGRD